MDKRQRLLIALAAAWLAWYAARGIQFGTALTDDGKIKITDPFGNVITTL